MAVKFELLGGRKYVATIKEPFFVTRDTGGSETLSDGAAERSPKAWDISEQGRVCGALASRSRAVSPSQGLCLSTASGLRDGDGDWCSIFSTVEQDQNAQA